MKDLELRGAGNLLGTEQSGHMMSVGYELYCKMLEEAVGEAQGIEKTPAGGRDDVQSADTGSHTAALYRERGAQASDV